MSKLKKATVALGGSEAPRGSKIRRDPPIAAKKTVVRHRSDNDRRIVIVGITAFGLAIFIIIMGFSSYYTGGADEQQQQAMRF